MSLGGAVSIGANYFDFSSNNALPKSPFENCVSKGIQNVVSLQRPNFTLENMKVGHFGNLFRDCGYFCPSERLSRPAINWELMSSSMAAKCIASRVLGFEKASKAFPNNSSCFAKDCGFGFDDGSPTRLILHFHVS